MPDALAISAIAPWAAVPLLMLGGLFLCYEGFEKLAHKLMRRRSEENLQHAEHVVALADPAADIWSPSNKDKIKGSIRTDFILSAEIITITLGTVAMAPFAKQMAVLTAVAVLMAVAVYALAGVLVGAATCGWKEKTLRAVKAQR